MSKMIECSACKHEIASSAKNCPNCGAKNKKPIYKKWWAWVIVLFIVFGLFGEDTSEGDNNTGDVVENNGNSEQPEAEKEFYSIGEEVKLDDNILLVNSVEKSQGSDFDVPKDGHEYVIVDVTIKNIGDSNSSYNPFDFTMQNSNGQITDTGFITVDTETALSSGELAAGGEVSGTISFEQPTNDEELILIYSTNMFSDKSVKVKLN